ncbi:phage repressor protein [Pantoea agglomerans]|uniref:phage repressor protein n=1 Tax=Enterobacter agglomerans TaxID=549 RepID=UPI00320A9B97
MGSPSPAADFVEKRIDMNDVLMPYRNNMLLIETPDGVLLADKSLKPVNGDTVVFQLGEFSQLGKLIIKCIINQDGETIDGEFLAGAVILCVVTFKILSVYVP